MAEDCGGCVAEARVRGAEEGGGGREVGAEVDDVHGSG